MDHSEKRALSPYLIKVVRVSIDSGFQQLTPPPDSIQSKIRTSKYGDKVIMCIFIWK